MIINIGDKVTLREYGLFQEEPVHYEVIDKWECETVGTWYALKHPDIAGYFTHIIESIEEVINESR
jgi:hypothetical protein